MELTILERLNLLGILPAEGNFVTQKVLQRLRLAVGFSEEDIAKHNIVVTDTNVRWDSENEEPVNIPIGKVARAEIIKALEKLDKDGKVGARHLTLFEKFDFGKE